MALSYAGVPLLPATPEAEAWVAAHISTADLWPWYAEALLGAHRAGLTLNGQLAHRAVKLGRLRWPVGACEWASAFFLASTSQLASIRSAVYGQGAYSAQPLILSDNSRQISTPLWLLPPRPLAQLPGAEGLWLLPLVDDRYWWWFTAGSLAVSGGSHWGDLIAALGGYLGLTIATDPIPSTYLQPGPALTANYESLPPLLDTLAYNLGMRVVRGLDGSVSLQNPVTAQQAVNLELAKPRPVSAGGLLALPAPDSPGVLPAQVVLTFLEWADGSPTSTYQALSCTPAGTGQSDLSGLPTNPHAKTFHETAVAVFTSGTWTNQAELQALTTQTATDWYRWQLANLDLVYCGVADWVPNGMADVEWDYSRSRASTRVSRVALNDRAEELMHLGASGDSGGDSNTYINITVNYVRDTFNYAGPTVWNVTGSLTINGPGYLDVFLPIVLGAGSYFLQTPYYVDLSAAGAWNNFDTTGYQWVVITNATGPTSITGIIPPAVIKDGRFLEITNLAPYSIFLTNEDAGSTAANRVHCINGSSYHEIRKGETNLLKYSDATLHRWLPLERLPHYNVQNTDFYRSGFKLIAGANVTITGNDVPASDDLEITIAAAGAGNGGWLAFKVDDDDINTLGAAGTDFQFYTLPARWVIHDAIVLVREAFTTNGANPATTFQGKIMGDATGGGKAVIAPVGGQYNLHNLVAVQAYGETSNPPDGTPYVAPGLAGNLFGNAVGVYLRVAIGSSTDNPTNCNAGSVEIYLRVSGPLPAAPADSD